MSSILFLNTWYFIGLTFTIVLFCIAGTSGGHVNPAVSLAMYLKGTLSLMEMVGYMTMQVAGAIVALYAFKALKKSS